MGYPGRTNEESFTASCASYRYDDAELQALRLIHNQELLFPNRLNNKEPMRSESILAVIKRSGYAGRMTTYGFRSLFSTVLNKSNLFNPDAIER